MHGASGHTLNRVYTEQVLNYLGYPICQNDVEVEQQLKDKHFAYLPLEVISPILAELIGLRNVMGLRSPIHTLARLINPFNAKATLQAIFHPAYRSSHQQSAYKLGYQNSAVIKGEGGEFERNPDAKTLICGIKNGELYEHELPKLTDNRSPIEEELDLAVFKQVWEGQRSHEYGEIAVSKLWALHCIPWANVTAMKRRCKKPENSGIPVFRFDQTKQQTLKKTTSVVFFSVRLNETDRLKFRLIFVMIIITLFAFFFSATIDITATFGFWQVFHFPGIDSLHTGLTLLLSQRYTIWPLANFNGCS
jgi:Anthranilate phosphoribosyltransferase